MSSKSSNTAESDNISPTSSPYPDGLETTSTKFCPHCGGPLDESLAQHMARGLCEEHTSRNEEYTREPEPEPELVTPPLLEEHDSREHVDDDLEDRQALADELEAKGVWVDDDPAY